jgi:hypothetical protein
MTPLALAVTYVLVVALLALVAWDEAPVAEVEVDESRGTLPPDAY